MRVTYKSLSGLKLEATGKILSSLCMVMLGVLWWVTGCELMKNMIYVSWQNKQEHEHEDGRDVEVR